MCGRFLRLDPWMTCHGCMHSLPIVHSLPWDLACRSPLLFFSLLFLPIIFPLPNRSWRAGWYRLVGGGGPSFPSLLPLSLLFALFVFPNSNCLWVVSLFFFSMGARNYVFRMLRLILALGQRLNVSEFCLPTSMICMATEMS